MTARLISSASWISRSQVSIHPMDNPCFSKHSRLYCEQLGYIEHLSPSTGEINCLYFTTSHNKGLMDNLYLFEIFFSVLLPHGPLNDSSLQAKTLGVKNKKKKTITSIRIFTGCIRSGFSQQT